MNTQKDKLPDEPFNPDDESFDVDGEPFDPDDDRPVETDELNFSDDEEPSFETLSPEKNSAVAETIEDSSEDDDFNESDDVEPEDLIKEDGARSSHEPSSKYPADTELHIVSADDIGAGYGLDEAELARVKPLDNKP